MPAPVAVSHTHAKSVPIQQLFIPYNAQPALVRTRIPPPTLVQAQEVDIAREMTRRDRPDELLRAAMLKQKAELHQASLKRAQGWGNTIMGGRRQRLAAKEERTTRQEEERQRVDAEWEMVKAGERQAAVDRARHLQYVAEPRIKQLHASLLLSNVLQERDEQVEVRRQERLVAKAEQARLAELVNAGANQAVIDDLESKIKTRVAALRCGVDQQAQAREREKELAAEKRGELHIIQRPNSKGGVDEITVDDMEFQRMQRGLSDVETARARLEERTKKHTRETLQRQALDEATALRRRERDARKSAERRLDVQNVKFAATKAAFDLRRKEAETHVVKQRQRKSDLASRVAADEAAKVREQVERFHEVNAHAHDGQWEKREAAEEIKNAKAIVDTLKFQVEHAVERSARLQQERADAVSARIASEVKDASDLLQDHVMAQKCNATRDLLKAQHRTEIQLHKTHRAAAQAAQTAEERAFFRSLEGEDEAFEAYAMALVKEWSGQGKDIKPLLRVLRQERGERKPPGPRTEKPLNQRNMDTFARLGMGYVERSGETV
ncbi:hypothetical protein HKX48_000767 [Thoreauomyces humboldtii]|nr:hypothetical protein HKX48_000767 [Thoreauomyces humboldtii]